MQIFQNAWKSFRARRKWQLSELSDWVLAPLGATSFLVAGYWTMAVLDVLPGLVGATNRYGLTLPATAAFLLLTGFGITIWFHSALAARCHAVLMERHFR